MRLSRRGRLRVEQLTTCPAIRVEHGRACSTRLRVEEDVQRLDPPVFDMGDVRAGGRHRKRCPIWRAKRCCASFLIGMQISARSRSITRAAPCCRPRRGSSSISCWRLFGGTVWPNVSPGTSANARSIRPASLRYPAGQRERCPASIGVFAPPHAIKRTAPTPSRASAPAPCSGYRRRSWRSRSCRRPQPRSPGP